MEACHRKGSSLSIQFEKIFQCKSFMLFKISSGPFTNLLLSEQVLPRKGGTLPLCPETTFFLNLVTCITVYKTEGEQKHKTKTSWGEGGGIIVL